MGPINIQLNGEEKQTTTTSIISLLTELKLNPEHVIVEINGTIINKDAINHQPIKSNDTIEIIRYIGGGQTF